ncbi:MAG TPA: cytochrome c oxidase subunit 3 [Candidatus Binatus sp.]|nr:cytochrome c oxidase subunit 3 [Candidatus Binatus sp.]
METGSLVMPRRVVPLARPDEGRAVSNARLAMIILIAGESMLFAGLIGAYLVFRLAARNWPPPDLPRLPLGLTAANSVLLLASGFPMARALRAARRYDRRRLARSLGQTALLGGTFLVVQGIEWVRLVRHGLTLASGTYGATFYVLIGCHGVHVLAAVTWLVVTGLLARRGAFIAGRQAPLEMCAIYWYFVCALWVVLFPLVYLS